jgi:hypothetical protein
MRTIFIEIPDEKFKILMEKNCAIVSFYMQEEKPYKSIQIVDPLDIKHLDNLINIMKKYPGGIK